MESKNDNQLNYLYMATCSIRKEDGTEQIKIIKIDTEIPYRKLHVWNKLYYIRKCHKKLYSIAIEDKQIVKCKIIHEEFILLPLADKTANRSKGWFDIRKIFLVLEMIILIAICITQTSMAIDLLNK